MPSLNIACATGPVIEFGGRLLRVSPRTIGHIAEIQAQILYLRGDPTHLARILVSVVPDEQKEDVATACLKTIRHKWTGVSSFEMGRFLSSPEGMLLTVCQAFDGNGLSREWIYKTAIEQFDEGDSWFYDLLWAMQVASGDSDLFELCSIRNIQKVQVDEDYDRYGGDNGIIAAMCSNRLKFTPEEVRNMTFRQAKMILAGTQYSTEDDRQTEVTETKNPANKTHRRLLERDWKKRYTPLIENIVQGKPLFDNLQH